MLCSYNLFFLNITKVIVIMTASGKFGTVYIFSGVILMKTGGTGYPMATLLAWNPSSTANLPIIRMIVIITVGGKFDTVCVFSGADLLNRSENVTFFYDVLSELRWWIGERFFAHNIRGGWQKWVHS